MTSRWLNLFLRFSGYIFGLKQKIVGAKSWINTVPYVVVLLFVELGFLIISFPLYLAVSPKKLQERGLVFPSKEKESAHLRVYIARRKIGLAAVFGAGGIFLLKFIFISAVSIYLIGAQTLLAALEDWNFNTPADYTYDAAEIEVTGGAAQLKDISASGGTTNPGFNTDASGWTYYSWEAPADTTNSGSYVSSGGNPGGFVQVDLGATKKNKTVAGYWMQSFTTTIDDPASATLSLDWKAIAFVSPTPPNTFQVYAFVDNDDSNPHVGQSVWSSGEITGTTAWAGSGSIDITSKLTAADTYYLKIAVYAKTPGTNAVYQYAAGVDNVSLNWSRGMTYANDQPTIEPTDFLTLADVISWNSFTETATKNGGEIYYQLSHQGGSWKYWDGLAWSNANTPADSNTAVTINANISSFSIASEQIKWKAFLTGDGMQQVILDNVAVGYTQNSPPSVQNLTAEQNTASGFVHVNYSLQDNDSDPCSLANYQYSLTGAFAGEEMAMTAATGDPAHSGIADLSSSPGGTAHTFVWNAETDLGSVFLSTVYVRLRANDGITNSVYATSSVFILDYAPPTVSSVTAVQTPGSSDVQINYDLSDNTLDNILVELQISSDGGVTWDVPTTSATGDIGSAVTAGTGKEIIWDTGVDFPNHEENDMKVQIRAKDKYQNQGVYASSADWILDNASPVVATPADLLAQPHAGDTAVLVGGSFTEGNPNTNNFYVALNGASYGSATAGGTNTATPADQSVSAEVTLKGNDYISAVKIEHTDDFGRLTSNENNSPSASYKYVKPYTPLAPTITELAADTLSVTINKNLSEADGLEYAIFESLQNKYVQADGTFGDAPYWQPVGSVTIAGLAAPLSQYIFQVKSRNPRDTSYAATSESEFGNSASSDHMNPSITINSAAQTTDGTKYVVINYTGTDSQDRANNLIKYEYSANGTDWLTMTEKLGVGSSGVASLPFTASGASLVFAWDVGNDLPGAEDSAVYARLQSNDSISNSNIADASAFAINTAGPVISNLAVSQTSGTDSVVIGYDLADGAGSNTVVLSVSDDSGTTWNISAPNASGDFGSGITAGVSRSITWDVSSDLPDWEKNTMRIKLAATDSYGNQGEAVESGDFSVDTKTPVVSGVIAVQTSGSALVTVNYNLSDLSFSTVEFEVSSDSGVTWDVTVATYSGDVGAGIIAGAKSFTWNAAVDFPDQELSSMRVRVSALDYFGHQSIAESSSDFAVNTKMLSISNITAVQNLDTKTVAIHYDLNKDAEISSQISSDGGATWDVAVTTLSGDVGAGITAGNNKTVAWDAGVDFNNQEKTNMRVRFSGLDNTDVQSPYYESTDFSVDTAAPLGLSSLSKFASTDTSVTLNWSAGVADAHFKYYELWHGATQADIINRAGTATSWSVAEDAALNNADTNSTVITGINLTSDYYVKIWAADDYGNEVTVTELNVYSAPALPAPSVGGGVPALTDTTSPAKPILTQPDSPTKNTQIAISGLAEPGARVDLYDNGVLVSRLESAADDNGKFGQTFSFSAGQHVLTVKAIDFSNNVSVESNPVTLNIIISVPITPIVLSPKNNSSITVAVPILVGVAESLAQVEINLDDKNNFTVTADAEGAWSFSLPSSFALEDGLHTFVIGSIDAAGNVSLKTSLVVNKITPRAAVIPQPTVSVPVSSPVAVPPASLIRESVAAVELPGIPEPLIVGVSPSVVNDTFTFTGMALPNQEVIVYMHSDQALVYRTEADDKGVWTINHSQNIVELSPGEHTVYAVAVDSAAGVKSRPSPVSKFTVEKNVWVSIFRGLNLKTTVLALVVVLFSMIWLYWIKKTKHAF
jgi:hypothetical protein